ARGMAAAHSRGGHLDRRAEVRELVGLEPALRRGAQDGFFRSAQPPSRFTSDTRRQTVRVCRNER
ncbi:MAG: hypothetical protein ABIP65_08345, partial [Vicinamibacterales bacterium]